MKLRNLGASNLLVSEVGIGCNAFNGRIDNVSLKVLTTAALIPTAPSSAGSVFVTAERNLVACGCPQLPPPPPLLQSLPPAADFQAELLKLFSTLPPAPTAPLLTPPPATPG